MASKDTRVPSTDLEKPLGSVQINIDAASSTEQVNEKHDEANCEHIQWETGFWKRFPWLGGIAILTMLLCIIADGLILASSQDKFREEWPVNQKWYFDKLSEKWRRRAQIEPHVLLAIVNTVTNVALATAIGHGVAIAWWRRVLKGSTIKDLHASWSFASSALDLLTAGKRFNYIALAALMAKIALIDNVLLQQAVSTETGWYVQKDMQLHLPMATELPENYAGVVSNDGGTFAVSSAFAWDIYQYTANDIIYPEQMINFTWDSVNRENIYHGYNTGCSGWCQSEFPGFGFHWDCGVEEASPNYPVTPALATQNNQASLRNLLNASQITNDTQLAQRLKSQYDNALNSPLAKNPLLGVVARFIAPELRVGEADFAFDVPKDFADRRLDVGSIGLHLHYAEYTADGTTRDNSTCNGFTYQRFCLLTPAVVNYTLDITNITQSHNSREADQEAQQNGIQLIDWSGVDYDSPKYVNMSFEPVDGQFGGYRTNSSIYRPYNRTKFDANLKHIASWIESSYGSAIMLEYMNDEGGFHGYAPNLNAKEGFINGTSPNFGSYWMMYDPSPSCALYVESPLSRIGWDLNNLMVRSSIRAATVWKQEAVNYTMPVEKLIQEVEVEQWIPSLYYTTHWGFGGAAMGVIFFCCLCVLPSYWGFWQLGRKVTLGPIEVAGAFQAPVMDHPTVATHGEVDHFVKEIGKRQVRYGQVGGQARLAVAPPTEVTRPERWSDNSRRSWYGAVAPK